MSLVGQLRERGWGLEHAFTLGLPGGPNTFGGSTRTQRFQAILAAR